MKKELNLEASLDPAHVYKDVEYAIIATPTNYDVDLNQFDTSSVEAAIKTCMEYNDTCTIVIKSTIPEGYTKEVREKFNTDRIIFSPEFLRESKALYDNLYPSRIVVGTDLDDSELTKEHGSLQIYLKVELLRKRFRYWLLLLMKQRLQNCLVTLTWQLA